MGAMHEQAATVRREECDRPGSSVTGPLAGVGILLVDDDRSVRQVMKRILARAGANVGEAASAAEAFVALGTFRPQLIVSDINMPGEDGYSMMRRIRALDAEWIAGVPAIAVTGSGGITGQLEAHRAGFTSYLTKPFGPDTLVHAAIALLAIAVK